MLVPDVDQFDSDTDQLPGMRLGHYPVTSIRFKLDKLSRTSHAVIPFYDRTGIFGCPIPFLVGADLGPFSLPLRRADVHQLITV